MATKPVWLWERWPSAIIDIEEAYTEDTTGFSGTVRVYVANRHRGLPAQYDLTGHSACWRSFSEIVHPYRPRSKPFTDRPQLIKAPDPALAKPVDRIDRYKLQAFIRRFGPLIEADDRHGPLGSNVVSLADRFHQLGRVWSKAADYSEPNERSAVAAEKSVAPGLAAWPMGKIEGSLLAFMISSALDHLTHRTPHRRCIACGSWISLSRRSDRVYCDAACALFFNRNGAGSRGRWAEPERKIVRSKPWQA
jgi:hypothetical protein